MTTASGDTSTTMRSTKAEDDRPATNAPQVEGTTGEATMRRGKQKRNKRNKNKGNRADLAAKADDPHTVQTALKDVPGEGTTLVGLESIEPVGSGPAELKTKGEGSEDRKAHIRVSSGMAEGVSETPLAKEEIPIYKSVAEREETKSIPTETSTFNAAPLAQSDETPSPTEIREAPIQPTASPFTTSSDSASITPTSPPATESHLDFSPAAIFTHDFQGEEPPKHISRQPSMIIPSPVHPHQPEASGLVHTVTAHHHPPHQQAPHPQPNQLQIEQILTQASSIPLPPKPKSPAPPLHAPGPGVTAGRIVMLANPPPPTGCLAPTRERQLTEYNLSHAHASHIHPGNEPPGDNPYPAHSLYVGSTETHPTGYTQDPRAVGWPGTALRRGPYNSGLGGRNDGDEGDEGEGSGFFGRRAPTGATVNTKGYHRRGEDVGLVASLVRLWEKSRDWFQEWVQATR